jgi:hypothetical protein
MNYNDKPLLTRPQHRFYTGPNYLEIDMDVHNYAFIARKAFYGFIHRLAPVVFENAFVVQGEDAYAWFVLAAATSATCTPRLLLLALPLPSRELPHEFMQSRSQVRYNCCPRLTAIFSLPLSPCSH